MVEQPAEEAFDDLSRHLPVAGSIDRAAVPLGMYLAWCANHQLLSSALQDEAAALILRVRFREVVGSELLVAGCGGRLRPEHLNAEGSAFSEAYYGRYLDDFRATFGSEPYGVEDDWEHYDRIAPLLTRRLMAFRAGSAGGGTSGSGRQGGERRWWKFWR
jgi:hypothetical protein